MRITLFATACFLNIERETHSVCLHNLSYVKFFLWIINSGIKTCCASPDYHILKRHLVGGD